MARVEFQSVTKVFEGKKAVNALDLTVDDGEFLVLVGPSGCGKSTALRMIAGLETVDQGTILIGETPVTNLAPKDRDIAMVFQTYALYPHLSVAKNIAFPLQQKGIGKAERLARAKVVADTLGLSDYLDRKPRQLSGGQRQRVALARAIVRSPQVFLMDEPLSNLDASLRIQTRSDIVALQKNLGTTTIYVTHDQVEAMTMGHRIAVLNEGVLQQVGKPIDLYQRPINTFVAAFLGAPGMNLFTARADNGAITIDGATTRFTTPGLDGPITVGARAEDLRLASTGIPAHVTGVEILGADVHVLATTPSGSSFTLRQPVEAPRPELGENVTIDITATELPLFDPHTGILRDEVAR